MADTMRDRLDHVHPQMLRAPAARGEADPQLSGEAFKRQIGTAVEAALDRAGLTKQEAAFAMGYTDSGVVSRWVNGTEAPQFARLWTLGEKFRAELVVALAGLVGQSVEVETVVRVRAPLPMLKVIAR